MLDLSLDEFTVCLNLCKQKAIQMNRPLVISVALCLPIALYLLSPYRLDGETWVVERTLSGTAHSRVNASAMSLGDSWGASYTANGALLIWRAEPLQIEREIPFNGAFPIKMTWRQATLSIETHTHNYTFTFDGGLSAPSSRAEALEPTMNLTGQSEMERLSLPKDTRDYAISKTGVIYGLMSDGSLFRQTGITRDVIPSGASEITLNWSEHGVLVAQRGLSHSDQESQLSWLSAVDNITKITWSTPAHREVHWRPDLAGRNLLVTPQVGHELYVSSWRPDLGFTPPVMKTFTQWKTICPPRASTHVNGKGIAERLYGLNTSGHFTSAKNDINDTSVLVMNRFEKIACAPDYAVGLVNEQGQAQLYLINLNDLSVSSYPHDLEVYLPATHLALNRHRQLGVSSEDGFFIVSPSAPSTTPSPSIHFPLKALSAAPSPEGTQWIVHAADGQVVLIKDQNAPIPILGPRGVERFSWPHPRVITWSGVSAGILIAPPDGDFTSASTQVIYYRPETQRFEYAKTMQTKSELKRLDQLIASPAE